MLQFCYILDKAGMLLINLFLNKESTKAMTTNINKYNYKLIQHIRIGELSPLIVLASSLFRRDFKAFKKDCEEFNKIMKDFILSLVAAISEFVKYISPIFNLETIYKILKNKELRDSRLVSISIRDLAFIDQQFSDENQPILLG